MSTAVGSTTSVSQRPSTTETHFNLAVDNLPSRFSERSQLVALLSTFAAPIAVDKDSSARGDSGTVRATASWVSRDDAELTRRALSGLRFGARSVVVTVEPDTTHERRPSDDDDDDERPDGAAVAAGSNSPSPVASSIAVGATKKKAAPKSKTQTVAKASSTAKDEEEDDDEDEAALPPPSSKKRAAPSAASESTTDSPVKKKAKAVKVAAASKAEAAAAAKKPSSRRKDRADDSDDVSSTGGGNSPVKAAPKQPPASKLAAAAAAEAPPHAPLKRRATSEDSSSTPAAVVVDAAKRAALETARRTMEKTLSRANSTGSTTAPSDTVPALPVPPPPPVRPPRTWLRYIDDSYNTPYFFHPDSEQSTWQLPEGDTAVDPADVVGGTSMSSPWDAAQIEVPPTSVSSVSSATSHEDERGAPPRSLSAPAVVAPGSSEAGAAHESQHQVGTVASVKQTYGFLQTATHRRGDLFFHFDSLDAKYSKPPRVGDVVRFTLGRNPRHPTDVMATNILYLGGPGTAAPVAPVPEPQVVPQPSPQVSTTSGAAPPLFVPGPGATTALTLAPVATSSSAMPPRARSRSAGRAPHPAGLSRGHSSGLGSPHPGALVRSSSGRSDRGVNDLGEWVQYHDPQSGRAYWHNARTNQTTWERP